MLRKYQSRPAFALKRPLPCDSTVESSGHSGSPEDFFGRQQRYSRQGVRINVTRTTDRKQKQPPSAHHARPAWERKMRSTARRLKRAREEASPKPGESPESRAMRRRFVVNLSSSPTVSNHATPQVALDYFLK